MKRNNNDLTSRIAALMLLAGCGSGGIQGEVDGQAVGGMKDALYDEFELFGVDVVLLWLSDAPDSCEFFDDAFEVDGDCEEQCSELGEIAETYLDSDEHWTLALTLRAEGDKEGEYSFDTNLDEDSFKGDFTRWDVSVWADMDRCVDECEEGDELTRSDSEPADGGDIEVTSADDEEMSGNFAVTFEDGGELEGSFAAERCDMGDWLAR